MIREHWEPSLKECEELLRELIRIDTCQPKGNEEELVDWLIGRLPKNVNYTKLPHGNGRASLVVKLEGVSEEGGLAFIGHIDTVACGDENRWKYRPHEAIVEDGIMYGRGTADMKGGDAAMLLAFNKLCEEKISFEKPVYFCFTADEEKGGTGILEIVEKELLETVEEIIICEPSNEEISICEKGALWLAVQFEGLASHASRPDLGINAVEAACAFAEQVKEYLSVKKEHPLLGRATASVTKLEGGLQTNMIPPNAVLELDIRTVPGILHDELRGAVQDVVHKVEKLFPGIQIHVEVINDRPAAGTEQAASCVERILKLAEEFGMDSAPRGTHFYTDASQIIPGLKVPFVIAGPGDDKLAHCIDEHVELASVARFAKFYEEYAMHYYGRR